MLSLSFGTNALPVEQGNYAEAESFYRRSLSIQEKVWGVEHPNVASDINNLAASLVEQVIASFPWKTIRE